MGAVELDPEMQAFVDRHLEVSSLSTATSVAQQRIDYEAMLRHFRYPHPAGVTTRDCEAAGRHGPIALRRGNDRALILFLHGGGFILGSLDSHDDICAELCARATSAARPARLSRASVTRSFSLPHRFRSRKVRG